MKEKVFCLFQTGIPQLSFLQPFTCTFQHYKALVVKFGFQEVIGKIFFDFSITVESVGIDIQFSSMFNTVVIDIFLNNQISRQTKVYKTFLICYRDEFVILIYGREVKTRVATRSQSGPSNSVQFAVFSYIFFYKPLLSNIKFCLILKYSRPPFVPSQPSFYPKFRKRKKLMRVFTI